MASPRQQKQPPAPLLLNAFSRDEEKRAVKALAAGAEVTVDLGGRDVPRRLHELLRKPGTAGSGTLVVQRGIVDGAKTVLDIKRRVKLVHMRLMCVPKFPTIFLSVACEVEAEGCLFEPSPQASLPQNAAISKQGRAQQSSPAVAVRFGTFTARSCSWQGLPSAANVLENGTCTFEACHFDAMQAIQPKLAYLSAGLLGAKLNLKCCLVEGSVQESGSTSNSLQEPDCVNYLVTILGSAACSMGNCTLRWHASRADAGSLVKMIYAGDYYSKLTISKCEGVVVAEAGWQPHANYWAVCTASPGALALVSHSVFKGCGVRAMVQSCVACTHVVIDGQSVSRSPSPSPISSSQGASSSSSSQGASNRPAANAAGANRPSNGSGLYISGASVKLASCKVSGFKTAVAVTTSEEQHQAVLELQGCCISASLSCLSASGPTLTARVKSSRLQVTGGEGENMQAIAASQGAQVQLTGGVVTCGQDSGSAQVLVNIAGQGTVLRAEGTAFRSAVHSQCVCASWGALVQLRGCSLLSDTSVQNRHVGVIAYDKCRAELVGCELSGFGYSCCVFGEGGISARRCSMLGCGCLLQLVDALPGKRLELQHCCNDPGVVMFEQGALLADASPGPFLSISSPASSALPVLGRLPVRPFLAWIASSSHDFAVSPAAESGAVSLLGQAGTTQAGGVTGTATGSSSSSSSNSEGLVGSGGGGGGGGGTGEQPRDRPLPICVACGAAQGSAKRLRLCAGCFSVHYCSEQCMRGHWGAHKLSCSALAGLYAFRTASASAAERVLAHTTAQSIIIDFSGGGSHEAAQESPAAAQARQLRAAYAEEFRERARVLAESIDSLERDLKQALADLEKARHAQEEATNADALGKMGGAWDSVQALLPGFWERRSHIDALVGAGFNRTEALLAQRIVVEEQARCMFWDTMCRAAPLTELIKEVTRSVLEGLQRWVELVREASAAILADTEQKLKQCEQQQEQNDQQGKQQQEQQQQQRWGQGQQQQEQQDLQPVQQQA